MYDIDELERKWLKYKRRKIATYISVTVLSISIIVGTIYMVIYFQNKRVASLKSIKRDRDVIVKQEQKKVPSTMNSEVPSMHTQNTSEENIEQPRVLPKTEESQTYHKPKHMDLIIKDPQSGDIVKDIINRFKKSKSYDDAIYLAEYYYSKKDYKKAEYWAMQANIINSLPEESWLIFAKSKVKSGHRVEALKVLQAYYDKTGSTTVLELIDLIRKNGDF